MIRDFLIRSFALSFILSACTPTDSTQSTRQLAQEMNDHQIKRVTAAQLTSTVDEWGKAIVDAAQKSLTAELDKTSGNPGHTAGLCELDGITAIQNLEKRYKVQIDLLGANDVKNPELFPKERELLDAYLYNAEKKLPQSDNIQPLADTLFVYNAPVAASTTVCQTCSDSAALPFVVWRVVFNKREVIRGIDPKKLR